jgi:hypothetical protein
MKKWIVVLVMALSVAACDRNKADTEREAAAWAKGLPGLVTGVDCMKVDSDDDGYVTCTVFREDHEPFSIQCAKEKRNSGCRLPPRQVPR